jgi:excisionase family DNA binding protein
MNFTCEPMMSAEEAAQVLQLHPKTVKRLAGEGTIPAMKIGRLWRFRASALDEWLRAELSSQRHPCPRNGGDQ